MSLNKLVLVLNSSFEPLHACSARDAIKLIFKCAATIEAPSLDFVHTPSIDFQLPDVIRLTRYAKVPKQNRSISRRGILLRDGYACQYCGKKLPPGSLTLDHVIPRSSGGQNTWENLVSACNKCNNRKSNRSLDESGMTLIKRPIALSIHSKLKYLKGNNSAWSKYLFC